MSKFIRQLSTKTGEVQVSLIKKYFPHILMWLRDDYPLLDRLLERYAVYDDRVSAPAPAAE